MKRTLYALTALLSLACAMLLSACGPKEPVQATFQTVEEQRTQGRSNAAMVAAEYQRQNPRILGWEAIIKGDASHTAKCPQGDGWTEVVFMRSNRAEGSTKNLEIEKFTVMCSTVSFSEGCVAADPKANNWDKHPKKTMDGQCAPTTEVPMPLPKVVAQKL